ncbi:hypothetical protein BDV11DRAFT_168476 [Aspergillus similis]
MSSNIFDQLQSPGSYDADFDNGWRLISEKGDDPVRFLHRLLQNVYWDAVRDEFANVILAFDDYKTLVPEGLPELKEEALESEYLRELLDLWDPIGLSEEIKNDICKGVFKEVKERQKVSQDEWIARALLQACGFADYDYVQEYRRPTFPSLGPAPQKRVFPGIYEAIQCSECRFCIRSFHFYECKQGCKDYPVLRSHMKCVLGESAADVDLGHMYLDCLAPPPYRLCCNCMETSSHPRSHLRVSHRFRKAGDEESRIFSQELDVLEDHLKGQSLLSFGNAFLDLISFGGLRRSVSSRRLFPAGNAHCALMFGPLLIENGMTVHPGGALISTRTLPSLGRCSPREVKEYLRPENYRTIQGCDVFCNQLYSVSPDRRIYKATKTARERRFLCTRKQLSGGLFTNYNSSRPDWTAAEDELVALFLRIARIWRNGKSPVAYEADNKSLLRECAAHLTDRMQCFFSAEIDPHLILLAQKLGKTQKLGYSRMNNNCQDFCNGLLNYESYYHPLFDYIYPFIPVALSPDIKKKVDEGCVSYLQSFVRPLRYPIPGSSSRAMLGSALTMYSSYAQNDADLIDHVYSARFFLRNKRGGDPYLLKDEEMSCSDRFAASNLPSSRLPPNADRQCTLADHLLDYPVDNLSVLQTHLHRQRRYYVDCDSDNDPQDLLINLPSSIWVSNRLQILRRIKLLHDFLAEIAGHFQVCCRMALPTTETGAITADVKTLHKIWRPGGAILSRAFHMDKRVGNTLHTAPDIEFKDTGDDLMMNWTMVGFLTFGTTFMQTHRQIMGSNELFMTRLKTVKDLLLSRSQGKAKEETWLPWKCCTCKECNLHNLKIKCHRLDLIAADNGDCLEKGEMPVVKPGHPDYISPREINTLLRNDWESVKYKTYLLEWEEKRHESMKADWQSTYLLCLRVIFSAENADVQLVRERLEAYAQLEKEARGEQLSQRFDK